MLCQTDQIALVFNSSPNQCEFYHLDIDKISGQHQNNVQAPWGKSLENSGLEVGHMIKNCKDLSPLQHHSIKPYSIRKFQEPILSVTWHNNKFVSFQLFTKLFMYEGNNMFIKIDTVFCPFESDFSKQYCTEL